MSRPSSRFRTRKSFNFVPPSPRGAGSLNASLRFGQQSPPLTTRQVEFSVDNQVIDLAELKADFEALDENHDGAISPPELIKLLVARGLSAGLAARHVRAFMRSCDTNGDGLVSYSEFFQEYVRMQCFKSIQCLVKMFGKQGSRADLTRGELCSAMSLNLGQQQAVEESSLCFAQMDVLKHGRIPVRSIQAWCVTQKFPLMHQPS